MKFYSQFGEDEFIFKNKLLPEKGFFVDVGAASPDFNSNTYFFEKRGWDGLCIDADPKQIHKMRGKRKQVMHGAVLDYDGKTKIDFHRLGDLTRVSKNGADEVHCFKLETVFDIRGIEKVDYLSIDVEGQELAVLKGLPAMTLENAPKVIVIEYTSFVDGDRSKKIIEFVNQIVKPLPDTTLKGRVYELVHRTQSNLIFKKK